jgi:hypothetical protein
MKTITYMRPSGRPITLNDNEATREMAKRMEWKKVKKKAPAKPKKEVSKDGNSSNSD